MSPSAAAKEGQYLLQDLQAKYIVNIVHKQMTTAGGASAATPPVGGGGGKGISCGYFGVGAGIKGDTGSVLGGVAGCRTGGGIMPRGEPLKKAGGGMGGGVFEAAAACEAASMLI